MHSLSKAGGYIVRASWSMFVVGGPSEQTQTPLLKIQAQLTVTKTCIESSVIKGCERFWVCAGNSSLWLLHNLWPMSNSKVQKTHHPASPPTPTPTAPHSHNSQFPPACDYAILRDAPACQGRDSGHHWRRMTCVSHVIQAYRAPGMRIFPHGVRSTWTSLNQEVNPWCVLHSWDCSHEDGEKCRGKWRQDK